VVTPSTNSTEEYDGSTWTAKEICNSKRLFIRSRNTNCSISFWRYTTAVSTSATEEYDGSAWTAGGSLNTARKIITVGIQTAASFWWSSTPLLTGATEEYNGTLGQQ
jgi:hypothetical protein